MNSDSDRVHRRKIVANHLRKNALGAADLSRNKPPAHLRQIRRTGSCYRTNAAAQLSGVAAKSFRNNRPNTCCASMPTSASEPTPLTHSAKGSKPIGPALTEATWSFSLRHSSSCARTRFSQSRGSIVGKRRPLNESTMRERFSRNQFMGHVRVSKNRSTIGSLARALIWFGSLTSNRLTMPGIRLCFKESPLASTFPSAHCGVWHLVQS